MVWKDESLRRLFAHSDDAAPPTCDSSITVPSLRLHHLWLVQNFRPRVCERKPPNPQTSFGGQIPLLCWQFETTTCLYDVTKPRRRQRDFKPHAPTKFHLPYLQFEDGRNVAKRCSRKDYFDQTSESHAHPRPCLFPDHGQQIKSFLSKSLARVWQAQIT